MLRRESPPHKSWKQHWSALFCAVCATLQSVNGGVFPGANWETRSPEEAGLSRPKLDALHGLVGGRGCVVRHCYLVYSWGDPARSSDVASGFKPVLSTLLLVAVQEGRIRSVDDPDRPAVSARRPLA